MPRRARGVSKVYAVGRGKRRLLSSSPFSTRKNAGIIRVHVGAGNRGTAPTSAALRAAQLRWKPKRGRRKLGARRKITWIESLFRWIKVPTGKVSRRSRRR